MKVFFVKLFENGFTLKGCLRLRLENKEFRVKIVWFGFGVSERGSKLKTTLHGDLIFNGWQLCNRGGMPPVGEIRTISDTINTMSQSRSSVVSFNFFLCLLTVWIIELKRWWKYFLLWKDFGFQSFKVRTNYLWYKIKTKIFIWNMKIYWIFRSLKVVGSAKNLNLNLVQKELLTLEHNVLLPIYIIAHRYAILGIFWKKYLNGI